MSPDDIDLANRVVVVAGASRGIGRATARAFAARGADVLMFARDEKHLQEEAHAIGERAMPVRADVSDPDSVRAAFAEVEKRFGRLDVLVNNAAAMTRILLTAGFAWTIAVCLASFAAHASDSIPSATDAEARRSDFSGRWVPDFEHWQGVERLLDLQDAPWIVRQAIGRVSVVEAVTQTDDALVVELDVPLPLPGKVQRCPFDDRLRADQTPLGHPSRSRHYWEDPRTLVHVHELEDESGTPYTLTARRRLGVDGDTMVLEIVAAVPNQPDLHALQVYRRRAD